VTWLAPLALIGGVSVALPVLVHWLARHEADRRVFPTVRFLPRTPPTSVRRHRLTDVALLALRCAIVAAAAAALAQPALVTPPAPGGRPPRAVVVDTSASMARASAGVVDAAVETARADADVDAHVVIRAGDLRAGLAQAGAWLRTQPGAGDVVVISDFQVGAMSEADLDTLPASAGRRFVRVGVTGAVPAPAGAGTVRVHGAAAAEAAARSVVGDTSAAAISPEIAAGIVIAFEGAPEYAALKDTAQPIDTPAMYDLAAQIVGNEMTPEKASGGFFFLSNEKRPPDVFSGLLVLSTLPPDSVEAAALIARALRAAAAPAVTLAEREPDVLPDEVVNAWQREPRADLAPGSGQPQPLGRWIWALVLILLAVETGVRRARPPVQVAAPADSAGGPHARVA